MSETLKCIKKHTNPGEITLILSGSLDFMVRKDIQLALDQSQTEDIHHIILDLSQTSFIDCAVLGIVMQTKQKLTEAQIGFSLISAPGSVFDVLKILEANTVISDVSTTQEN